MLLSRIEKNRKDSVTAPFVQGSGPRKPESLLKSYKSGWTISGM
jgi:hypothetical protein